MASRIFKTLVPAIYRCYKIVRAWSRANVETNFEGNVNLNLKPEIIEDGLKIKVQLDGHATATQEIIVGGKTLEFKAHGDGNISGKWHFILKEKIMLVAL